MSDDLDWEPDDATPLSPEEREGLIPSSVTLRRELNELEQANILAATTWALGRRRNALDEAFARNLHRRLFSKVWRWAGRDRQSDKNIGVPHWQVATRLRTVFDDAKYWVENQSYESDELAVRFHHGLVVVHPFPNGNGRWARLMADLLAISLGRPRFTWGRSSLRDADATRRDYIAALKAADNHDIAALLAFARA